MIHWHERVLAPVVLGGLTWLVGLSKGHGTGFQVYVRYFSVWSAGVFAAILSQDLLEHLFPGALVVCIMLWTALAGFTVWKRHLA